MRKNTTLNPGQHTGWGPHVAGNIAVTDPNHGALTFTIRFGANPSQNLATDQNFPNLALDSVRIDNTSQANINIAWTE